MNRVTPGSRIHVPIHIDSSDYSAINHELSTVTFQTDESVVHGNVDQDVVESEENVANNYSNVYKPFKPPVVFFEETDRIKAIQVPFAKEPTRNNQDSIKRASPRSSTGMRELTPHKTSQFQSQAANVCLPTEPSGSRRSSRKRSEVNYNEDMLANKLPRISRDEYLNSMKESPPTHSLRIRASNRLPIDSDEEYNSESESK